MKRIAVATDLSERSDRALERALSLASDLNARCSVISIVDGSLPDDIASEMRVSTERRLRAVLDAHGEAGAEVDVRVGDVVPGILGIASELDADLLVLGLHRKRTFMDLVRETTMERIVSMAEHPVLLVRNPLDGPYRKVLVAVNFTPACAAAVSSASRIAPGAEVEMIHALHVPFSGLTGGSTSGFARAIKHETKDVAKAWMKTSGIAGVSPEFVTGGVHDVLTRKIQKSRPQLLAIGAHTRSGPGFHGLGSLAAGLIREPPADLLVARR